MDPSSPLERSPHNSPAIPSTSSSLSYRTSPGQRDSSPSMDAPIPDDQHGADLPMNMTASVMLTGLPPDAHQALADVERIDNRKVTVRFQPLPSAPMLKTRVFKVSASQKFETVVKFLRKKLDCKDTDSVFCYVNSVFAPGLDEGVGGLWRCFKSDDQLIVAYSMTPAFG
ncbi:Autophagy-related protein 12 [Penicillium longicatenatum]|uniref:Autophagy-related protein 12 n=1 Tax=Penicillium longicatenatum TaxID=1561947 RepID=UPI002546F276|nr:Autophagy-related protein 12 [Penicillium longicatenatum]KAJ5657223.1 Autophagy-related protein 12 [Penicillium longicatenatum]